VTIRGEFKSWQAASRQACQIFLGTTYQNGANIPNYQEIYLTAICKINQIAVKYTKFNEIYKQLPLQDPFEFTQFGFLV
jgi:hypothetical protein